MTDADDARLVERLRQMKTEVCDCRWHSYPFEEDITDIHRAADLISTQRREIEDLRRELAEALKVIAPFAAYGRLPSFNKLPADWPVSKGSGIAARQLTAGDIQAASAFAAKHGGRE